MLAQFSIWPLDNVHLSQDVAEIKKVLDKQGISYRINAMSTTLEGEWREVFEAIHACHEAMQGDHQRVLTSITIDDGTQHSLESAKPQDE